jgi:3-oxocholest-4-en-26-oate---CoA ligase
VTWSLGDVLEAVADAVPADRVAIIHGNETRTWSQFQRRSNNVAAALLGQGLAEGDRIAFFLRNHPAYLESAAAAFKARLTHVNVNYRFVPAELNHILEDSGSRAVLYAGELRHIVDEVRPMRRDVRVWIQVGGELLPGALDYEDVATRGPGSRLGIDRSADDVLFIYTGGTTGRPKGVVWTHGALLNAQFRNLGQLEGSAAPENLDDVVRRALQTGEHVRQLPAAPLIHATAMVVAVAALVAGGCVVLPSNEGVGFDADAIWQAVQRHRVTMLTIVGDPFARPLLRALDSRPGHYDLRSLRAIISSGAAWSETAKRGLLGHLPWVTLMDTLSSTEAPACGTILMTADGATRHAFRIGPDCKVFDENSEEVTPGSGRPGVVARAGPLPLRYHNDPEKTERTFRTIGGVRYAIPGDYCLVEPDGTLTLLGRGSQCVNSAGEKVFVEEVEEALMSIPGVDDAMVTGIPDPTYGEIVAAAICRQSTSDVDEEAIRQELRARLAGYKIPKRMVFPPCLPRLPSGKPDYTALRRLFGLTG